MSRLQNLINEAMAKPREAKAPGSVRPGRSHKPNDGSLNKTEEAYRQHLEILRQAGEILWFDVHCLKIRLAKATFWDTDFLVVAKDGTLEIHETKGFMEQHAAVKAKVVAYHYPFRVIIVRKRGKDGWDQEVLNP